MPLYPIWIHDKATPKPEGQILYEISANGVFLHKETPFWNVIVPVERISILEEQKPNFELKLPQIPIYLALSAARFFSWVTKNYNTESLMLLWINKSGTYQISVPVQRVSHSYIRYDIPTEETNLLLGSIHSHGTMPAFHSETDRDDEQHFDG